MTTRDVTQFVAGECCGGRRRGRAGRRPPPPLSTAEQGARAPKRTVAPPSTLTTNACARLAIAHWTRMRFNRNTDT